MVTSQGKFTHINSKGVKVKVSIKQLLHWNTFRPSDSKKNRKRKNRNLSLATRRRTLTPEQVLAIQGRKAFVTTRAKPLKAKVEEVEEAPPEEKPPEVKVAKIEGLKIKALVGLSYDSKSRPFYAAMLATFRFRNKSNYRPTLVLQAMQEEMVKQLHTWWQNSFAAGRMLDDARWITEGEGEEGKYGIILEEDVESTTSTLDYEFYVSQSKKKNYKVIKSDSVSNPIE